MTLAAKSWSSGRKGDIMNINWTQLRHCSAFPPYLHCFGGDSDEASLSAGKTLADPEGPSLMPLVSVRDWGEGDLARVSISCQMTAQTLFRGRLCDSWNDPQVIFKVTGLCRKFSDWALCPSLTFLIYCLINPFHHLPQVPAGTARRRCKGDGQQRYWLK